jgi:hypothetical protein
VKEYSPKIIIAWAEAISGNKKLGDWLKSNGYAELSAFVAAINLEDSARDWLLKEGFPELMALVRGAEGDEKACKWLRDNDFCKLALIAEGADNEDEAIKQLLLDGHREWAMISLKIRAVKNDIQAEHDDWHSYSQR